MSDEALEEYYRQFVGQLVVNTDAEWETIQDAFFMVTDLFWDDYKCRWMFEWRFLNRDVTILSPAPAEKMMAMNYLAWITGPLAGKKELPERWRHLWK